MRTDRETVSHELWNTVATSCHDSRFAHPARNQAQASVTRCLPVAHGTDSTFTPQRAHATRRIA